MIKQLKNRYNDPTINRKFVIGIDRAKMKLFDVEQTAQKDILDSEPTFKYNEEPKFNTNKFADFTF
jgi:hypothetical protein